MKKAILLFVSGFVFCFLLQIPFQSWTHPVFSEERFYELITWTGEFIRDFTPWPLLFISLFIFESPRRAVKNTIDRVDEVVRNLSSRIKDDESVEIGLIKLRNSDPKKAKTLLSKNIQETEKDFEKRVDKLANEIGLETKLEKLHADVFRVLFDGNKLAGDAVSPRITIHMDDPLYKNSVYQLVDYIPKEDFPERKRGRRFSTRHGIVGLAWRTQKPEYDPEVDEDPDKLVRKWGMTEIEAKKAGRGRKSHMALPLPRDGKPKFILFFDAQPKHIFGEDDVSRKEEIVRKIYEGVDKLGIDSCLKEFALKFGSEEPIIDFHHGP